MAKPKKGALHQVFVPIVDATDFASIESGVTASDFNSGATVKFYGMNTGGSAATTSGTVSKTASLVRSGVFRCTIKGTENNYDLMMLRVNKTGIAEQIIVWSNVDNDDSDLMSQIILATSAASDAASAAAQANSRVLLVQSRLSDLDSRLASDLSDVLSGIVALSGLVSDAHSAAILGASNASDAYSAALLIQSRLSDLDSRLVSDLSDVLSQLTVVQSMASDAASAAQQGNSRVLLVQSRLSDLDSRLVSDLSDVLSQLTVVQSMASDAASAAVVGASRALLNQSRISDVASYLAVMSGVLSDVNSATTAIKAKTDGLTFTVAGLVDGNLQRWIDVVPDVLVEDGNFDLVPCAVRGFGATVTGSTSLIAWFNADCPGGQVNTTQFTPTTTQFETDSISEATANHWRNRMLGWTSGNLAGQSYRILASSNDGTYTKFTLETMIEIPANTDSFTLLPQAAYPTSASDISDIASAARVLIVSDLSDILSAATAGASRALLNQSRISDVQSYLVALSALVSDIESQIDAGVEIGASSLSDLRSAITATELDASDLSDIGSRVYAVLVSDLSDILSAAQAAASRALLNQSRVSDVYSLLSDLHSDVGVMSGILSDAYSNLAAGVTVGASSISDIQSAVFARGISEGSNEPAFGDSFQAWMEYWAAVSKNKITQSTSVRAVRNAADNADITSFAVSDDGTTFIDGAAG